jgi:aminoglycoside phosphotransferase family enzyme/predicted kinase
VSALKTFEAICRAMARPDFYPHPVAKLERRETHISVVFLAGDFVYKLKKPVDFGFLDYTLLETRKRMCELEVELNRRLADQVYLGVVPICTKGDQFRPAEGGAGIEYGVKMRRLPDEASLSSMIEAKKVTPGDMTLLGERLFEFFEGAKGAGGIEKFGALDVIGFNTEENFRQLRPFVGDLIDTQRFEFVMEASRTFLKDRSALFQRRIEEGKICDGHGDLRAEHVYFLDRIQVIDCVEFSPRLRCGDRAADLAFLHMDVERLGRADLSLAMLQGYTQAGGDFGIYTVLDFYSCYRAVVKAKVSCLGAGKRAEMKQRASRYFDLAFGYAVRFARPAIYVLCGLPGSGKSTWAKKIAEIFGLSLFSSDALRRELPEYGEPSGPVAFATGIYKPGTRTRAYSRLLGAAQLELKKGCSVVLDATFSKKKWREEVVRLAEDLDANIFFLECFCSQPALLKRLVGREGKTGLSDARKEHLPELLKEFEPLEELREEHHLKIPTEAPLEAGLPLVLSTLYSKKQKQVDRIIGLLV